MALLLYIFLTLYGINMAQTKPMSYPYLATQKKSAQILNHWKSIQPKMSDREVIRILGEADEIVPLYEPLKKNPKLIGKTWWYILQRDIENGTQAQKNEKVVRISFDKDDRVISVDKWGF